MQKSFCDKSFTNGVASEASYQVTLQRQNRKKGCLGITCGGKVLICGEMWFKMV